MSRMMICLLVLMIRPSFSSTLVLNNDGNYFLKESKFLVVDVIRDYAKLKGINLIMEKVPKGELLLLGPRTIKKEDIDLYISAVLEEVDFTIIEDKSLNQMQVIKARDVRFSSSQFYKNIVDVPNNYNHVLFNINLKHIDSKMLTRNLRPFLSSL